ncbi:MAG TPA: type IV pilus assembly protein PilM [Planctomycetes bacterium]|nr:type IV pilus assembly protein PilM [Planctomycetota bacterium]
MFSRQKSLVGLDIGSSEVKVVELTETADGLELTGFGWGRIPAPEETLDTVKAVLRESGIRSRKVVTAVSGRSVVVRYIILPQLGDDELPETLRLEADKYIPFDRDEVCIDGQRLVDPCEETSDSSEMRSLLVAVKKDLLHDHIDQVQDLGLVPVAVDVDSFALGNSFELRNGIGVRSEDPDKAVALVDVGASKTNIHILRGNVSSFSREIYLGGSDLTEAISRREHLDEAEAEELKCEPLGNEEMVATAVQPVLDEIAGEIQLSFDYFENQFDHRVEEIFISGGASRTIGLQETFERFFDREVKTWDPLESIKVREDLVDVDVLNDHLIQLPIAIGLGSRLQDCV